MLTLSRLSADLVLFTMPEFGYFTLPAQYCTGSSIMPQKQNPDVLELIRAKAARVLSHAAAVGEIVRGLPGGYNRDLQETKVPLIEGIAETRASLRLFAKLLKGISVNRASLAKGFSPDVFAADAALDLAMKGVPFRDAYNEVKKRLKNLALADIHKSVAARNHLGGPAGVNFRMLRKRAGQAARFADATRSAYCRAISRLLGTRYSD